MLVKPNSHQIGNYLGWKLEIVTNSNNAKIRYYASFDRGGQYMPEYLFSEHLEDLKSKIRKSKFKKVEFTFKRKVNLC